MATKRPNSAKASAKAYYNNYPLISVKKRVVRVKRHLKKHPEDLQTSNALANGLEHRGAKKPLGSGMVATVVVRSKDGSKVIKEKRNISGRAKQSQILSMQWEKRERKNINRVFYGDLDPLWVKPKRFEVNEAA